MNTMSQLNLGGKHGCVVYVFLDFFWMSRVGTVEAVKQREETVVRNHYAVMNSLVDSLPDDRVHD